MTPADTRLLIRPLTLDDLDGLMHVQAACYGALYLENADVYRARIASSAQCSLVAVQGGAVVGYLAAYRSVWGCVTPLHGAFGSGCSGDSDSGSGSGQEAADTLYLHDMAVLPRCAGQGVASALLSALWQQARSWAPRYSALVSVQGSQAYWQRKGYVPQAPRSANDTAALQGYGHDALYMAQGYRAAEFDAKTKASAQLAS